MEESKVHAGEAIEVANERMGLVFDSMGRKIWERGVTKTSSNVGPIKEITQSSTRSSTVAAMQIILAHAGITVEEEALEKEESIITLLNEHMQDKAVNVTGISLDNALYFVSQSIPVLAMKTTDNAVIITAYDEETITVYNPKTGTKEVMLRYQADAQFKEVGNIFITYVKD